MSTDINQGVGDEVAKILQGGESGEIETEVIEGVIVNKATGEVIGFEDALQITEELVDVLDSEDPAVTDAKKLAECEPLVDYYLERRSRALARLAGIELEQKLLTTSIVERLEGRILHEKRKIEWLDKYYNLVARTYVKLKIEGRKEKSVSRTWGVVGFRATQGTTEITDNTAAAYSLLEILRAPEAVRVTIDFKTLIEKAPADVVKYLTATIVDCFDPLYVDSIDPDKPGKVLGKVTAPEGLSFQIMKGSLPANLPDKVKGIQPPGPADPLGSFYVESESKKAKKAKKDETPDA